MLFVVLLLVLGAFGLLVAALTTANTLWAWISVAISLVAAGILVADWLRGRRRRAAEADTAAGPGLSDAAAAFGDEPWSQPDLERIDPVEHAPVMPSEVEPAAPAEEAGVPSAVGDPEREPDEEATDAADLLVVSDLRVDVRVLDERPRYHLTRCAWLAGRPAITLPVAEARELGFTPCAVCTPDSVLAARHREGRGARDQRSENT
nr:hypothetical protein [Actinokineospora enzanensis]